MIRVVVCWLVASAFAAPLEAQVRPAARPPVDRLSVLGIGFIAGQQFAAKTTFDAVFGDHSGLLFGAGMQITEHGVFMELALSRFERTGQRAYVYNGEAFPLNVPLTATLVPFEVSGGYQFRRRTSIVPYAGGGVGTYRYKETSSFADPGDDVDVRHVGYLVVGGAEFRIHRWIGLAGDVQYTHIGGILGTAGLSKDADENDLGGLAVRARVLVGVRR